MKKTLIFLLCLFAALLLFASCDGSCHHLRMQSETVSPDCTHEGYILHTCPDCGYTYKSDYLKNKRGHQTGDISFHFLSSA